MLTLSLLASAAVPFVAAPAGAVPPPGTTTLVSPADGEEVGGNPVFTWTPVEGAAQYRFQISTSSTFGTVSHTVLTSNLHVTPATALPLGTLHWRVAPTDAAGTPGTYTAGFFNRVWSDAPAPISPEPNATLNYPQDPLLFRWEPVRAAKTYRVQVDTEPAFTEPLVHNEVTNNTSLTITAPQTNAQQFYWRVQGSSDGVNSPWSEPRGYVIDWPEKPVALKPGPGETVTDVVFEWTPVIGAVTYQLQASPNPDFTNNLTIDVTTTSTRYSPPVTIDNGSYFWRVRARDNVLKAVPNYGDWSDEMVTGFTRAWNSKPTLESPANGANAVNVPTLRWSPVPHASHYEVWLSTTEHFTSGTYATCLTNQTSLTPFTYETGGTLVSPTLPSGPVCTILPGWQAQGGDGYYWKVRAIDGPGVSPATGIFGVFSDTWRYVYRHAAIVQPTGPDDDAATSAPVLSWERVDGVSRYRVHIFDGGTKLASSPFTTWSTSYTPTTLTAGKTYTWYVRTLDDQGREGSIPSLFDQRRFTYVAPAEGETVTQTAGISPPDLTSSSVLPSLQWLPVTGAKKYNVFYGRTDVLDITLLGSTELPAYTFPGVIPNPGTYRWTVQALDENNNPIGSYAPFMRFVVDQLAVVQNVSPGNCTPNTACTLTPDTPTLTWEGVPYAGGYRVHLSRDKDFTNVERIYDTPYTSLTPRESLLDSVAGQAWYWFVQPCRGVAPAVGCGRFDDVLDTAYAFRKRSNPVVLVSPAHEATISGTDPQRPDPITFTWADYTVTNGAATPASGQGGKTYRLQVSTVQDFATTVDDVQVDQTTYTPWSLTYPEGPLYWRVGVVDNSSNQLTFSAPRLVEKRTPDLIPLHPAPGATESGTPYFQWKSQAGSSRYELEVYKNGDTLYSTVNKAYATTLATRLTAYTPTKPLAAGAYAWRIRRWDANGTPQPGPWSSGGVFTVAKPAPELVSPDDKSSLNSHDLVFTWSEVPGAAAYLFEASTNSGFTGTLTDSATTVMTSWAPIKKYADGVIYWRVKVVDGAGNVLSVSSVRSVGKDSTAPKVTAKGPTTNLAVTGGALTATFSEPVVGLSASTFTMRVANTATGVPGVVTPGVSTPATTATFSPSVPLVPGETYTMTLSSGITDPSGNPLPVTTWNVRATTIVDSVSPVVQHFWDRDAHAAASGGAFLASRTQGSKVTYSFTGTSVQVLGRRARDGGYAEVWLDGVKQPAPASFYSSADQWKAVVFQKTGLANAAHKLELRVTNTKPSASAGTWVYPDAFRAGVTTVEETHASVVQSFRQVALTGAVGGSYEMALHTATGDTNAQPYILLKFKGTGVSWKGFRGNAGGIAGVYLDNVGKGTVDQYGAATSTPQVLWSASGLTNTTHTLRIVLTGGKRSTSAGYNVTFDSFTVV